MRTVELVAQLARTGVNLSHQRGTMAFDRD
jgi:hypothetical protein